MSISRTIHAADLKAVNPASRTDMLAAFQKPYPIFLQNNPNTLAKLNELFHPKHTIADIQYLLHKMKEAHLLSHHTWTFPLFAPTDIELTDHVIQVVAKQIYKANQDIELIATLKKNPALLRILIRSTEPQNESKGNFSDEAIKKILMQYLKKHSFPTISLQDFWQKLSSEKPPFKIKNIIDLIRPVFGNEVAKNMHLRLKEAEIQDLVAESSYQVFLDMNQYNEKLLELLTQPSIKAAIIHQFKNHPIHLDELEKKCSLFHMKLSSVADNQRFVDALNQVFNVNLTERLNALPPPLQVDTYSFPPVRNAKFLTRLRQHQQYADFMLRHQSVFVFFPRLKAIFEYGPVKKILLHHASFKNKNLNVLVQDFKETDTPTQYQQKIHKLFPLDDVLLNPDFLLALGAKISDEVTETASLQQELKVYHFFNHNQKAFQQLPQLQKLISSPTIMSIFYRSNIGISKSFLDNLMKLPWQAFETEESIHKAIVTALALEPELSKPLLAEFKKAIGSSVDFNKLRGELKFYKYLQECRKIFNTVPVFKTIFENENVKKALCDDWGQAGNFSPPSIYRILKAIQNVPDAKLIDIPTVIYTQLKTNVPHSKLQSTIESVFIRNVLDLAKFKWQSQYGTVIIEARKTNATLARVIGGQHFSAFLWMQKKIPPTLEKINALSQELAELTEPYALSQVTALFMDYFSIDPTLTEKFLKEVLIGEGFSAKSSECKPLIIELKVNAKYALFFEEMRLSEFPYLRKIFDNEAVQKVLFKYWEVEATPNLESIKQFTDQFANLPRGDHARARGALFQLIFSNRIVPAAFQLNKALDAAHLFNIPNSNDQQLQFVRGEARWSAFQAARGLSHIFQASKNAIINNWRMAENSFPDFATIQTVVSTLATGKNHKNSKVFKYVRGELSFPNDLKFSDSDSDSFAAEIYGISHYDQFLLKNQIIRKICPELYKILTHPLIISALSHCWQTKVVPDNLHELIFELKSVNSNDDLRQKLNDFFGINLNDALTRMNIPADKILGLRSVRLKKHAEKADIYQNFNNIADPALRDYFKKNGILLEEKLTKELVNILNQCMRENPTLTPREKKALLCDVLIPATSTLLPIASAIPEHLFADTISLQNSYLQFSSSYLPDIKYINAVDVTTPANQILRDFFLKNDWQLSRKQKEKLLRANYRDISYAAFTREYLQPATNESIHDIQQVFKEKDYAEIQKADIISKMETKFIDVAMVSFKGLSKIRLKKLERTLDHVKNDPAATSNPKIISEMTSLQQNLPTYLTARQQLAIDLNAIKSMIETYQACAVNHTGFFRREKLDYLSTLKNILQKLSVHYAMGSVMANAIQDILLQMNSDRKYHVDTEKDHHKLQILKQALAIYHALEVADQIDTMIQQNKNELDRLKKLLSSVQQLNDSIKLTQQNEMLVREQQRIVIPYSHIGSPMDNKSDQKTITAEQEKLKRRVITTPAAGNLLERKKLQTDSAIPLYDPITGTSALFHSHGTTQTVTFDFKSPHSFLTEYTEQKVGSKKYAHLWDEFALPVTANYLWGYLNGVAEQSKISNHKILNKKFCKELETEYYKKFFTKFQNGWHDTFYLPNPTIFKIVYMNLNMQVGSTHNKQLTLKTNDYAIYIAAKCIAEIKGYKIKDQTSFQNNAMVQALLKHMKKYIKTLKDPKNGYTFLLSDIELSEAAFELKRIKKT